MSGRKEDSALGVARARFVDGLPKKGSELKGALALLAATPDSDRPREEMRRRLHALYASAQVFRIDALAEALKECIDLLDAARDRKRALVQDEIDRIAHVAATLPAMASVSTPLSEAPGSIAPRVTRKPASTLQGLGLPIPSELPPPRTDAKDAPTSPGGLPATTPGSVPASAPAASASPSGLSRSALLAAQAFAASTSQIPEPSSTLGGTAPEPARTAPVTSAKTASTLPTPKSVMPSAARAPSTAAPATSVVPSSMEPRTNVAPERPSGAPTRTVTSAPTAPTSSPGAEKPTVVGHRTPGSTNAPTWTKPGTMRPTGASLAGIETVISVLLVGDAAKRMADKLPKERFEVVLADEHDAVERAKVSAPDVIVAGEDILTRPGGKLVASLRGEPSTDLVPLIAVAMRYGTDAQKARTFGADDAVSQVADARTLMQVIARASGLLADSRQTRVGSPTVRELVDRLTDEMRRGLVDAIERGAEETVPLDDGSEVLAAVWAAIARVRTEIGARSEGRVRFRETARRGGPSLLGFGAPVGDGGADPTLEGRRVIVADDDPAVVWFFAGLLREAGAIVEEVLDGEAALMAARKQRPDVILSDILMPKLDGLALCRELQRDPSLAEVPVILLSWKEDFLQRMRELRSGASGYLRKEEGAQAILARVSSVLAPRARFEARLRGGGEIRGRVEGLGVLGVLRAVGEIRTNASVSVRDAHNLFEIEIRDGDVVHITRTASDGSFARGPRALPQLLGVTAGRFTVEDATAPVRPTIQGGSGKALADAAERLGAQVDAVSGQTLTKVETLRFDEDVLASVIAVSTPDVVAIAKKLEQGTSPRALVVSGEHAPSLLESVLADLARRGAITAVLGANGEDRVEEALARRRGEKLDVHEPPSAEVATPWLDAAVAKESPDAVATEDDVYDDVELEPVSPSFRPSATTQPVSDEDVLDDDDDPSEDVAAASTHGHSSPHEEPTKRIDMVAALREAGLALPPVLGSATSSEDGREPAARPRTPSGSFARAAALEIDAPFDDAAPTDVSTTGVPEPIEPAPTPRKTPVPMPAPRKPSVGGEAGPRLEAPDTAQATPLRTPEPKKGVPLFIWGVLFVALAGIGFAVTLAVRHMSGGERPEVASGQPNAPEAPDAPEAPEAPPTAPQAPEAPVQRPAVLLYGSDEPTLRDVGVQVPDGQGLLVLEAAAPGADVTVDGRARGRAPTALALPPGRHEVVLARGDETRVRFVFVEPGHTRVLPAD